MSQYGQSGVGGYEPSEAGGGGGGGFGGGGGSSMQAIAQLFARLSQEIEEQKPKNCIHFIVDFLCKHYPEHLHGFASIWQMDPDLERERHEVVNFFKAHKISTAVAAHFTNAGYDTLDTLTTLNKESLVDIEAFNNVKWLPGHKVRLQQIFGEIAARVRAYRQQYGNPTSSKRSAVVQQHRTELLSPRDQFPALQAPTYVTQAAPIFLPPQIGYSGQSAPQPAVPNYSPMGAFPQAQYQPPALMPPAGLQGLVGGGTAPGAFSGGQGFGQGCGGYR